MILLYHSVIPDDSPPERLCVKQALKQSVFEHQIRWLTDHYRIVPMEEYLGRITEPGIQKKRLITITFDDGYRLTFDSIFPILLRMNVPVTIFVSTDHICNGTLLWFSYLKALCFEGLFTTIKLGERTFELNNLDQKKTTWYQLQYLAISSPDPRDFCDNLALTYPLDLPTRSMYEGITEEQLTQAKDHQIINIGSHTKSHPFLNRLSIDEQEEEIVGSKNTLSQLTGKKIRYFAYPGGYYSKDTLNLVKKAGYEAAFAVIPQKLGDPKYEYGRIGIYSPSFLKFQLKVFGLSNLARWFGLKSG